MDLNNAPPFCVKTNDLTPKAQKEKLRMCLEEQKQTLNALGTNYMSSDFQFDILYTTGVF